MVLLQQLTSLSLSLLQLQNSRGHLTRTRVTVIISQQFSSLFKPLFRKSLHPRPADSSIKQTGHFFMISHPTPLPSWTLRTYLSQSKRSATLKSLLQHHPYHGPQIFVNQTNYHAGPKIFTRPSKHEENLSLIHISEPTRPY